jgi:two-component system, OmpR family, sensor kinase
MLSARSAAYSEQAIMEMDDQFFARVGHDLRGELATMLAGVHYVLRYEKELGASSRDMLERVRGAGERLKRLLDELDNAIWLRSSSRRPLSIARCDAGELARSAASHLEAAAAARGVELSISVEAGSVEAEKGAITLEGDAELLRIGIEYVLGFAIVRSRDLPVRILVASEGAAPVVKVIDEAGPVSPEPLARLLEPFGERAAIPVDRVAPRRRERLGLGLAIARGIFDAHGGGLSVELSPGAVEGAPGNVGLRFTCTLHGPGAPWHRNVA